MTFDTLVAPLLSLWGRLTGDNSATAADSAADWDSTWALTTDSAIAWLDGIFNFWPFDQAAVRSWAREALAKPAPYWYGKPDISVIKAGDVDAAIETGADCSGMTLVILVAVGLVTADWAGAHRSSSSIQEGCTLLALGAQRCGDVACYDGHVTLVLSDPDDDGHSWCLSMSGGTSSTKGDNLAAHAMVKRGDYRTDFRGYFRPPSS